MDDKHAHKNADIETGPRSPSPHRRLVRPLLLSLLSRKLRVGGTLHIATDVEEYGNHVLRVMAEASPPLSLADTAAGDTAVSEAATTAAATEQARTREDGGLEAVELDIAAEPLEKRGVVSDTDRGHPGCGEVTVLCWEGGEEHARPEWRPSTKYESKAREAGRRVRDFSYRLIETRVE